MSVSELICGKPAAFEVSDAVTANRFVQLDTTSSSGKVVVKPATGVTDIFMGVALEAATASGQRIAVARPGCICYLNCSGNSTAVTSGCGLTATTGGVGIKTTTASDNIGAIAIEASSAATTDILVEVVGPYMNPDS